MTAALKERGELSRGEARAHRLKLQRELAAQLRRADREKRAELRERIARAKRRRRERLAAARELCRSERAQLSKRLKAQRAAVMAELRDAFEAERRRARETCAGRQTAIRQQAGCAIAKAERILAEQRRMQDELRRAEQRYRTKSRERATAKELRAESDDRVRANLPPELVPVFERVKERIKPGPRRTRTEAFLEWAHENPGDVVAIQSAEAEADIARLIAEHEAHEREMRKPGRYKQSPERLAEVLADVPF